MAAKLKKRALAEYPSSNTTISTSTSKASKSKKIKLVPSESLSIDGSREVFFNRSELLSFSLDKSTTTSENVSAFLVASLSHLSLWSPDELLKIFIKMTSYVEGEDERNGNLKAQIYYCLSKLLPKLIDSKNSFGVIKEKTEIWIQTCGVENSSSKVVSSLLSLLYDVSVTFPKLISFSSLYELCKSKIKHSSHRVIIPALQLLGVAIMNKNEVFSLIGQYSRSQDSRIRFAAFETLLSIHQKGRYSLELEMIAHVKFGLRDDYEGVRRLSLSLLYEISSIYPDYKDKKNDVRLIDDAFGKICNAINDLSVKVRETAAILIGNMKNVSQSFLEQTLDKKLMSNMRLKSSSHEIEAREGKGSGDGWSTGRNWSNEAPKQELEADSVNLMNVGACGAFIHGLEDEYMAVRSESVESLTKLSINNSKLAALALDFLVDMFNDEIEIVRVRTIESLTRIATHISLQVHQLETILSALDDFSIVVREKLHIMLQASSIATKDGLQKVIHKLLENLKKYPQDKRSILSTFKKLGSRHAELTLPLVTQLLEIHPFFDTTEPDIEDPSYLCILVLVFNAAQHCPTLSPLLDQHTRRHYDYMNDTYPHLIPLVKKETIQLKNESSESSSKFLKEILFRVQNSYLYSLTDKIKIFNQANSDLKRLSLIEPELSCSASFSQMYVTAQFLFYKIVRSRFWSNSNFITSSFSIVKNHIGQIFKIATIIRHRFQNLNYSVKRQIQILRLVAMSLHVLYLVRASNKSALDSSESLLKEISKTTNSFANDEGVIDEEDLGKYPFLSNLLCKLGEEEEHKPGVLAKLVEPLLLSNPLEPLSFSDTEGIVMSKAVIYDPVGHNEVPLKYTAGMVLAVPLDAELFHIQSPNHVRIAIKTPDQKVLLVAPKANEFFPKEESNSYRLLTNAIMSHQVWSEALHVDISIVLDVTESCPQVSKRKKDFRNEGERDIIHISDVVKVYVLPKPVKRGI